MRSAAAFLLLAFAFAGCFAPAPDATPTPTPTPQVTTPTPQTSEPCYRFDVEATPATGPAGQARTLVAAFENCGETAIRLAHACTRGMDLRILVLYNSTTPEEPAPPGVGPNETYLVDNPLAGLPLLCATAPPHVRAVAAGQTMRYAVEWSGLYAPEGCDSVACARILEPGRYLVSANALDAETNEAYIATAWMTLT